MNSLIVKNASKYFIRNKKKYNIFQNLNLELETGKTLAITGYSGSGKSTLLHSIGLLSNLSEGEIIINNQNCSNLSDKERTKIRKNHIGFIYQFHYLLPDFNAIENIAMPLMIQGVSKKLAYDQAMDMLEKLKLNDRYNHYPNELSGGEQQRIAIGRAIIHKPSLILADEPTGNLDPNTSNEIFKLMRDIITENNISLIFVTHNHVLAEKMDNWIDLTSISNN